MKIVDTVYGDFAVHDNDLLGNLLMRDRIWEPHNIALMQEYVKKGATVLDIGANIGFFSVVLSHLVGEEGRVLSFEPVAANLELLNSNVTNLSNQNVIVLPKALGKTTGFISMQSEQGNMGNSFVADESQGSVELVTLDSLNLAPSFIKMDVQGFEYDVLLGGLETLKKYRPVMIIELEDSNGSIPTSFKNSKENSLKLLSELNYTILKIESDYPVDYLCLPN